MRALYAQQPEVARQLWHDASAEVQRRYQMLARMAGKEEKPLPKAERDKHVALKTRKTGEP